MPLIKGKSEKSFKKNVETEMHEGKPMKQSLAIAYDVQRRAKKKHHMAHGGKINEVESMEKADHVEEPHNIHPGAKKHYMKPSEHEIMSDKFPKGHVGPHDDSEDAPSEAEYLGVDATGRHRFAHGGKVITAIGRENYPAVPKKEYDSDSEHFAHGGKIEDEHSQHPEHFIEEEEHEVEHEEHEMDEDHPKTIADAVYKKMKEKHHAHGGMIHKKHHYAKGGMVDGEEEGEIDDPFDHGEGISHFQEEGPGVRQKYNMVARNYNQGDDRQLKKQPHDSNLHNDPREEHEENIEDADMISKIRHKMKKRGY